MADSSTALLSVIAEVTPGTTPATPAFNTLRVTGESLVAAYETIVSNELNANADVAELRRTGVNITGDIGFELHKDVGFELLLTAALRGAWASNVVKSGILTPSFTFERRMTGITGTQNYFRFSGSRVGGMTLNFAPDAMITGNFSVSGTAHPLPTNAIIAGATYVAPSTVTTSPPMAGIDVTAAALSGVTGVDYLSATIELTNNLRVQRKLAAGAGNPARGVAFGRRQITGTITCYFEDLAAYTAFYNNATPALTLTASDGTNSYAISLPRIRITGGEVPSPGNDTDIILTLNYQATYDSTAACSIQITRAP